MYLEGCLAVIIADILIGSTEKQDAGTALLWEGRSRGCNWATAHAHTGVKGTHTHAYMFSAHICSTGTSRSGVHVQVPPGPEGPDAHNSHLVVQNTHV